MNINKEKKQRLIKDIRKSFEGHDTFYLFDFINMPVSQAADLRRRLRDHSFTIKVVKNRLALRALTEDLPEDLKQYFRGPTAIAFADENPLQLARLLRDFSQENKVLKFKAGLLEGRFVHEAQFSEVANITSREELLGKLGYLMINPLIRTLRTWQAPIESLGRLLSQLKSKK
jgi:large subunit ribosomal protein L10